MARKKPNRWWIIKPVVFVACLLPTAWTIRVLWLAYQGQDPGVFGDPIKVVREVTGIWTLRFLMITLAITPLRRLTGWNSLIRMRRLMGLFAFFQGTVHLAIYLWLDESFIMSEIVKDVIRRPFIASGMASFFLMLPLAVTSTRKWIKRLGGKRWQLLHRLIYFAGAAGVLHYYFYVKSDIREPLAYAVLLAVLLAFRGVHALRERGLKPATTVGV
ncbi:MAG TPA: protein-methionine-sulfoxide reductase heme-binding subunit MsrQ [Terriglobia bacterium]|jgi:sulfoxide reductase heme-binding subunit YedZ